jgi:hypothetical protein
VKRYITSPVGDDERRAQQVRRETEIRFGVTFAGGIDRRVFEEKDRVRDISYCAANGEVSLKAPGILVRNDAELADLAGSPSRH